MWGCPAVSSGLSRSSSCLGRKEFLDWSTLFAVAAQTTDLIFNSVVLSRVGFFLMKGFSTLKKYHFAFVKSAEEPCDSFSVQCFLLSHEAGASF